MKPFSLEEYLKNPNRKIVTRLGKPVRIACSSFNKEGFPIIAEVQGFESYKTFTDKGKFMSFGDSNYDLFFAPEKHEGWVNIYKYGRGKYITSEVVYTRKEDAIMGKNKSYLTTIKIEWEEQS